MEKKDPSIWNSGDLSPLITQAIWGNKSHKWKKTKSEWFKPFGHTSDKKGQITQK